MKSKTNKIKKHKPRYKAKLSHCVHNFTENTKVYFLVHMIYIYDLSDLLNCVLSVKKFTLQNYINLENIRHIRKLLTCTKRSRQLF